LEVRRDSAVRLSAQASSAAQQTLYFRLRKKPRLATERLCNQLVHGMAHGDAEDRAVDEMLKATGVPAALVEIGHKLTYPQAVTAGRTGECRKRGARVRVRVLLLVEVHTLLAHPQVSCLAAACCRRRWTA